MTPVVSRRSEGVPLHSCSPVLCTSGGEGGQRLSQQIPVCVHCGSLAHVICDCPDLFLIPPSFDFPHVPLASLATAPSTSLVAPTGVPFAAVATTPDRQLLPRGEGAVCPRLLFGSYADPVHSICWHCGSPEHVIGDCPEQWLTLPTFGLFAAPVAGVPFECACPWPAL